MATMVPSIGAAISQAAPIFAAGSQAMGVLGANNAQQAAQRQQDFALKQLQAKQALQESQLAQEAALKREELAASLQIDEENRKAALRRAVARQRASFGSSGLGNQSGGSSQAVLLGLFDETEDELAERKRLDALRSQALDLSISNKSALNVLQQTQLQERQNFTNQMSRAQSLFDDFF